MSDDIGRRWQANRDEEKRCQKRYEDIYGNGTWETVCVCLLLVAALGILGVAIAVMW